MFYKDKIFDLMDICFYDMEVLKPLKKLIEDEYYSYFYQYERFSNAKLFIPNYYNKMKCELFPFNILRIYERAFEKAIKKDFIDESEFNYLSLKVYSLVSGYYKNITNSQLKYNSILSILTVFESELPKVALMKLIFILVRPKIFVLVLKKYDEYYRNYEKRNNEILKNKEIFYKSESILIPEQQFQSNFQGPYDPNINHILNSLKYNGFIEIRYKNQGEYSKLTLEGEKYLIKTSKEEKYVNDLIIDAAELADRFSGWSGHKIESFLKDHILKDFSNHQRGDILWD